MDWGKLTSLKRGLEYAYYLTTPASPNWPMPKHAKHHGGAPGHRHPAPPLAAPPAAAPNHICHHGMREQRSSFVPTPSVHPQPHRNMSTATNTVPVPPPAPHCHCCRTPPLSPKYCSYARFQTLQPWSVRTPQPRAADRSYATRERRG